MREWTFLGSHAQVLLLIAHEPCTRLRDVSAALDITDRTAFGIMADLIEAGYVVKRKEGRRNCYDIQEHLPLRTSVGSERTISDFLDLFVDNIRRDETRTRPT
ncbi:MAG TPA: winged helix DNA-binding protein [Acidimicrobiales bacterium]|jgi:DNA-binding IclR family transcriptional regulator|nr:winged helix DNA-binding protein [Acidimicrobiales bacterium]